jgi:hypothetical protein
MVRVVLDTNVVVSALIGKGNPKRILELIFSGKANVCLSEETFAEYVEVLSRPKFIRYPEFTEAAVATLKNLRALSAFVEPTRKMNVCSDPDDDKFLELALEAKATYLITGNTKHFPSEPYKGIRIVSPAEFLKLRI